MDYNDYTYFTSKEYKKIDKELKDFELDNQKMVFIFYSSDGKKVDEKKVFTKREYNELSDFEKNKLRKWTCSIDYTRNYSESIKEINDRKKSFLIDFRDKAPNRFIEDFAKENNIEFGRAKELLAYTINNINDIAKIVMDEESESYNPFWVDEFTFDKFINAEEHFYKNTFETLEKVMKNNLNFLKLASLI